MIYQLPTRSSRRYRGKHPGRINSWSYGDSPCQKVIAGYLGMKRPVHIEDNAGYRYIADMSLLNPQITVGMELADAVTGIPLEDIKDLHPDLYNSMLQSIREARAEVIASNPDRKGG